LEALVPILVRPVREQLEHDRIIRLLEAKWRRKFKVEANPGDERNVGVKVPVGTLFPDLILTEEGGRKPKALVEVETNESVNHLEAMAQWAHLAKSKTALSLIVPVGAVEAARRLASENGIKLTEVWTYLVLGDQVRFNSVFREHGADPADLIEKVDVFTTERAAPAPRPVPVEPVEAVEPPAPTEIERPRKLAVKAGSRPVVDGASAKLALKLPPKAVAKAPASEPPAPPARPAAPVKPGAPVKAVAAKVEAAPVKPAAAKPSADVKPTAAAKPGLPVKPAGPAKAAGPVKPAPDKSLAPIKTPPAKAVVPAKPAAAAKPAMPPAKAAAAKAVEKAVAKKAAKPEAKKLVAAKPAPVKPAAKPPVAVKKAVAAAKPAPRPAARKAAPVRPAPRVAAAKKAAPVAKARPSKRK
jgi:hypothetical protein